MTFKPGDVVTLRAPSSPVMTVLAFEEASPLSFGEAGWRCCWFVQGAERRSLYPAAALQHYAAPECST